MSAAKPTNRRKKSDESRTKLLDAALVVIARKGYSAATVDEIVHEAGVSKGLAYYHFKNKADMASSILERGIDVLVDEFEQVTENEPDTGRALVGMLDVFAGNIFENREFGRFFVSELWRGGRVWSEELRSNVERLVSMISDKYRMGQQVGTVRQDIDLEFHSIAVIGLVLTTSLYYLDDSLGDSVIDKQGFVDRICDYARHASATEGNIV